jgi:hypothetical protein
MDHLLNRSILLKYADTAIPNRVQVHPLLRYAIGDVSVAAAQAFELGSPDLISGYHADVVRELVTSYGRGVYSIPYLAPWYCDRLLEEFGDAGFEVNPEEEPEARIPEIVLKARCKPLHDSLHVLWESTVVPLALLLWNLTPQECLIQAAQYTADEIPGTQLHTDQDSDVTLVVNLGTEFEGGGTEISSGLLDGPRIVVPALPKGHALFFLGRTVTHRGLDVTEGTRTLLVHWATL